MIRFLIPAFLFLVLTGFLFVGLYKDPSLIPSPLIGKPIPTFATSTLRDPNKVITDKDIQGDYALINVWATWCAACKQEHSALVYLAKKLQVPIYGLNYKDDRAAALDWLQQYGDPYVVNIFDENGRIGIDFGVYGAPETFLVDSDGIIHHKLVGVMTPDVWENQFVPKIQQITSVTAK
ncbi:MAG: DsbE family thiol:disulfide interchange protein [Gammaproteobacteria bacterium]